MNIMEAYALPKKEFYEWHVGNGCGYLVELDSFLWGKDRRILQVLEKRDGEEIIDRRYFSVTEYYVILKMRRSILGASFFLFLIYKNFFEDQKEFGI
ncbi:MAG: hypothetical protein V8R17_10000 [Blautia obeum]